jgi:uncharacterized membrane protein YccC
VLRVLDDVKRLRELYDEGATDDARPEPVPPAPADSSLFARQALQATLAGVVSFVIGRAISETRWPWAVLASVVVFQRSTTAGDTVVRAWQRVVGTVLGIAAGASLAIVLAQHRGAEVALMFVCVFLAFYFIRVSYAWSMAWMTALLALLYGVLGRFDPSLMVVRLEETIVGAGLGALAALLVLPERAEGRVREGAATILRGVAERLRGRGSSRGLERQLRTLREQVRPARRSPFVRARSTAQIARHVAVLVYSARHLAELRIDERARGVVLGQSDLADALADALEKGAPAPRPHREPASWPDDPEERRVVHWLSRIDDALEALGRELGDARA